MAANDVGNVVGQGGNAALAQALTVCAFPPDVRRRDRPVLKGRSVVLAKDVTKLSPAGLNQVIAGLAGRRKLTPDQLALLVAAANEARIREGGKIEVDPQLAAARDKLDNPTGVLRDWGGPTDRAFFADLQSLFDSSDLTTPNVPKPAIAEVLKTLPAVTKVGAGTIIEVLGGVSELPILHPPRTGAGSGAEFPPTPRAVVDASEQALVLERITRTFRIPGLR